ncbi:hypothetical protein QYF36_002381 [Acer negundo]|nr:hypothetical protein QYF36_002381 [Acer negundo]
MGRFIEWSELCGVVCLASVSGLCFGGFVSVVFWFRGKIEEEVAELPLVATSKDSQGQGYFQPLFSCIEKLLSFVHVKNLVLPLTSEAESIWTNKFGFNKMTEEEGTSILQKKVPKYRLVGKSAE